MHISHDFIATKTCPSYEFLVVFGQVRVWDRKSAGRGGCELEVCGAGAGKISQIPAVRGEFNFAGAGRERTQNFNSRRTLVSTNLVKTFVYKREYIVKLW